MILKIFLNATDFKITLGRLKMFILILGEEEYFKKIRNILEVRRYNMSKFTGTNSYTFWEQNS